MKLWKECSALNERGESFVVVTMTGARGSSPQDPGAKIIVTSNGLYAGTVGGGKVEMAAIKKAQSILKISSQTPPELITWNLQTDIGMSCGGEVTFLFEHFMFNHWPIIIYGAGHVAQALTRLLSKLNCHVTCIDSRNEWIQKLEGVNSLYHPTPKETVRTFNQKSFFICMTMGHAHDVPILYEIAHHAPDCPYVGVIGSDIKGLKIKKELSEMGVNESFIDKLRVPMGLPIGTNHPWEIAISIAAEMLQVRDEILRN
jgi:xanthine dehydrogenase accessory factor